MATNNWEINTDDYDLFGAQGVTEALPGTPMIDENGHLIIPSDPFFSPSTLKNSTMDKDPNNTGPTTSFWEYYPLSIDSDGYIFYYDENTGINIKGPAGSSSVRWADLTPEQQASLRGADGANGRNGTNGQDGRDGAEGKSAYQLWLIQNGWEHNPEDHPISDFFAYLGTMANGLVQEGTGNGSLILNYKNQSGSIASGAGSTALGNHTTAGGANSIAMGDYTITGYPNQLAIGKYNVNKPSSLFEIGNGLDINTRNNIFEVDSLGNVITSGDITDGLGNILSNKVDKEQGKQLSTNDFNNQYKTILDNYVVDDNISPLSTNPISSSAVYTAIETVRSESGKPIQTVMTTDQDLCFFHPTSTTAETMEIAGFSTNLTWNPSKKIFKTTNSGVTHIGTFAFGNNLISSENNQILFGQYNEGLEGNILEIGHGYSTEGRLNYLQLDENGTLTTYGDIKDGYGHTLRQKQNQLTFDQTITQGSDNIVTSGVIYDYLTSHGIDPAGGIYIPEIDYLTLIVNQLSSQVAELQNQVHIIGNPHEFFDDVYPNRIYKLGVYNGELYMRRIDDDEEEDSEEEEPEV